MNFAKALSNIDRAIIAAIVDYASQAKARALDSAFRHRAERTALLALAAVGAGAAIGGYLLPAIVRLFY